MACVEKFTPSDLAQLRTKLMKLRGDSWQAADLVSNFLAGRGYGVNPDSMRTTIPTLVALRDSQEHMQTVLESIAYVM
jgi:Mg2+ and Co2+ transporter CorA